MIPRLRPLPQMVIVHNGLCSGLSSPEPRRPGPGISHGRRPTTRKSTRDALHRRSSSTCTGGKSSATPVTAPERGKTSTDEGGDNDGSAFHVSGKSADRTARIRRANPIRAGRYTGYTRGPSGPRWADRPHHVYDNYAAAQQTVDFLSDNGFPVEQSAIVGTDLRMVENVLGRLTVGAGGAGRRRQRGLVRSADRSADRHLQRIRMVARAHRGRHHRRAVGCHLRRRRACRDGRAPRLQLPYLAAGGQVLRERGRGPRRRGEADAQPDELAGVEPEHATPTGPPGPTTAADAGREPGPPPDGQLRRTGHRNRAGGRTGIPLPR